MLSLFFFREHPRVLAVQRGAVDTVAFASDVVVAPLDAWDRLMASFRSRRDLQDEVLRLKRPGASELSGVRELLTACIKHLDAELLTKERLAESDAHGGGAGQAAHVLVLDQHCAS